MIDTCTTHRSRVPRRSLLVFIKLNIRRWWTWSWSRRIASGSWSRHRMNTGGPSGACLAWRITPSQPHRSPTSCWWRCFCGPFREDSGGVRLGAPTNGTNGSSSCAWTMSRKRSSCSSFMSISAWCWAWWRPASDFTSSASGVGWAVAWWRAGFLVPGLGTSVAGFGSVGKADEEVRGQRPTICVGPTVAGRDAQKHKLKIQAWSSLVFHCRHSSFNPSEAPPWDSRPVSGAGVDHYHLLHGPRSVPTALGPAPLATTI